MTDRAVELANELVDEVIDALRMSDEGIALIRAFEAEVRQEERERCAQVVVDPNEQTQDLLDGMSGQFKLGHAAARQEALDAIRALDEAGASRAPDPTIALAKLFADNWSEIPLRMLVKAGLIEADYHSNFTDLGRAALRLAGERG